MFLELDVKVLFLLLFILAPHDSNVAVYPKDLTTICHAHACYGLDCDLPLNEKKKRKPKFKLGHFPWKAKVIRLLVLVLDNYMYMYHG